MSVSFDANVLVYASAPAPAGKAARAKDLLDRGALNGSAILLLQTLGEFSHVTLRKSGLPAPKVRAIGTAWRGAMPVHGAIEADLDDALEAVARHRLQFWDAMLWATARRVGVRYLLTEDFQDGRELSGVTFVNPFDPANDELVDRILPVRTL